MASNLSPGHEDAGIADAVGTPTSQETLEQKTPSFLKFKGRTGLVQKSTWIDYGLIKNLDSLFDDTLNENTGEGKLKTFLRIRSHSSSDKHGNGEQAIPTQNRPSASVVFKLNDSGNSVLSSMTRKRGHGSFRTDEENNVTEFKFAKVLLPETTQEMTFQECAAPIIKKFLETENCLIFTYGAKDTGKSYTLNGNNGLERGIIPRSIDSIFMGYKRCILQTVELVPTLYQGYRYLSPREANECKLKNERILSLASPTTKTGRWQYEKPRPVDDFPEGLCAIRYALFTERATVFAIWVSYIQLSNDQVYDLLDHLSTGTGGHRRALKLLQDRDGFVYVKDVTEVHVKTAEEAIRLFLFGQNHSRFSTGHTLFTLRVVAMEVGKDQLLSHKSVHRITFCDLAGIRPHPSMKNNATIKEITAVNSSLSTLLKVILILGENQAAETGRYEAIPFRESKLTYLLKSYFTAQNTHVHMIVNMNIDDPSQTTNLTVLRNSNIASKIVVFRNSRTEIKREDDKSHAVKVIVRDKQGWSVSRSCKQVDEKSEESDNSTDSSSSTESISQVSSSSYDFLVKEADRLERENWMLKKLLVECELEKEMMRDDVVTLLSENEQKWRARVDELKVQETTVTRQLESLSEVPTRNNEKKET